MLKNFRKAFNAVGIIANGICDCGYRIYLEYPENDCEGCYRRYSKNGNELFVPLPDIHSNDEAED